MKWQAVHRERARKTISAAIGCGLSGEGLRISAISECLRTMLYLCSAPIGNDDAWESVASIRLTSMVRRRLTPLWPELTDRGDDTCPGVMTLLNNLAEIGDVARLDGGRWLTAPAHAVRIDHGKAVLLGGGPTETLPRNIVSGIAGRARFIEQSSCENWLELWDADEWIGAPSEGNHVWSSQLFAKTITKLTDAPNNMGDVTVYWRRKWIVFSELPENGEIVALCRTSVGPSTFSYFIGEFVKGGLRRLSSIESSDNVRRLRFYLDKQGNCPLRVKAFISQGLVKLRLVRRLPKREAKVLLLGWQIPSPEGEYPGVTHHIFPEVVLPIVRSAFEGLGIVWLNVLTQGNEIYE